MRGTGGVGGPARDGGASAIYNGAIDTKDTYPWVAYLKGATTSCTGEVVGLRSVITAKHCQLGVGNYVWFGPYSTYGDLRVISRKDAPGTAEDDLAMLELECNAPVKPKIWNTQGLPSSLIGQTTTLVGYGRDPLHDVSTPSNGYSLSRGARRRAERGSAHRRVQADVKTTAPSMRAHRRTSRARSSSISAASRAA